MTTLVIDWLGRGGITQVAEAWAIEAGRAGRSVTLVSRAGREITESSDYAFVGVKPAKHPLLTHRRVARTATEQIRDYRPDTVVIHNYIVPWIERSVHAAAAESGANVVFAIHDQRIMHKRFGALHAGLRGLEQRAGTVVAFTDYVGDAVAASSGRNVERIPLPIPVGMLSEPGAGVGFDERRRLTAISFGVMSHTYKQQELISQLAQISPDWEFRVVGTGATAAPGVTAVDDFLPADQLEREIRRARVSILPYRQATQSAVVVLSQVLGTVPIASAVGGIPEQIDDGVSGMLVAADASASEWAAKLVALQDADRWAALSQTSRQAIEARHGEFVRAIRALD